ncbi:nucleoside diphosphate kinase regulator [Marinobacter sp. GN3S48]|uniref:nucleoside diphosphate kinase regulator n=1 Tax=Marinobacter sp. GN3S48 TaxID=3382302 RepID=UPI00387AFE1A
MSERPAIYISETDFDRLSLMLDQQAARSPTLEALEDELDRATLVRSDELPEGTVTMNSVVHFINESSGAEYKLKLVYPNESAGAKDHVSVLAPAGAALLGLTIGDRIDWPVDSKNVLQLRIIQVTPYS